MPSELFRVAIVGCGAIARTHIAYLLRQPAISIAALCDCDEAMLRTTADRFRVRERFTELRPLLERIRPDVVHVLTPPGASTTLATAAMRAGCHVLVEKPLALTSEDARLMVQTGREAGVKLCVDHSRLLHPCVRRALRYLEAGLLGDLVAVEIAQGFTRSSPRPSEGRQRTPWSYTYPWGIFHNLVPHGLYYARAIAGEPVKLAASAWSDGRVRESAFDEMLVSMEGTIARARITLTLSTAPERNTVTLRGTEASVVVDTNLITVVLLRDSSLPPLIARNVSVLDPACQLLRCSAMNALDYALGRIRPYPDIRETLLAFYGALRGRNPLPATGEDGLAVVEMMEEVRRQAESSLGRPGAQAMKAMP